MMSCEYPRNQETKLTNKRINPPNLFNSQQFGFTQLVVSDRGTTVHCSGQVAWNTAYELVGKGDLAVQARESLRNVGYALEAAGAGPADVVRVRIYIVEHKPEYLPLIGEVLTEFFGAENLPASTLIGVQTLAEPDFLIEIEATAVI
jgi:enamine deaminase RidA (YjgF/YER057c/UK114 family)